jgi:sugar phosphate isomerase/epimerase
MNINRRQWLQYTGSAVAGIMSQPLIAEEKSKGLLFDISLAEWSLHKGIRKEAGAEVFEHLDFCKISRQLGIGGVEYVSTFFKDKAKNADYLKEMKMRQDGEGVKGLLIMVDGEGALGEDDATKRATVIENHKKWLDAAVALGCHSIRVNAQTKPTFSFDEQMKHAADGLALLAAEADQRGLYLVVENHGGLSSNGLWLSGVMKMANHSRLGILPDFGNFYTNRNTGECYNPYKGLSEFLPFVKQAVSAKAYDWDTGAGPYYTQDMRKDREMILDYERLIGMVVKSGYRGFIGIEYEGDKQTELEGIKYTKRVLEEIRAKLTV